MPGLVWVSYCVSSILRAEDAALGVDLLDRHERAVAEIGDDTAPAPDSSPMKAKFTGPDCANALVASAAANAAASMIFLHSFLPCVFH